MTSTQHSPHTRITAAGLLVALGIVYGDIGTSPLYTVRGVFVRQPVTATVVLGTISCIIWTLTLLTTVKYVLIALRADNRGEGGILALYARLTTDEPYTRRYHVSHVLPDELVRIDFYLGFRVDHALNYMFRQVVTDLVHNHEVDITSRYESLRGQDVTGDFQFIILNKTLPYEYLLRGWQRLALRVHGWLKRLGASETESFGLDNSAYTIENVPLHMPARPELQLVRE